MLVFAMDYFFVFMHILCLGVFCVKMAKTTQRETIKDDSLEIDAFVACFSIFSTFKQNYSHFSQALSFLFLYSFFDVFFSNLNHVPT